MFFVDDDKVPFLSENPSQQIEEASALVVCQTLSGPGVLNRNIDESKFLRLVICQWV